MKHLGINDVQRFGAGMRRIVRRRLRTLQPARLTGRCGACHVC